MDKPKGATLGQRTLARASGRYERTWNTTTWNTWSGQRERAIW